MVAPLAAHWVGHPHLGDLTPQINLEGVSLHKIFIFVILRLQDYFFYLPDCVLDRDDRLKTIDKRNHLLSFEILDQVNPANKVVVVLSIPE